MLIGVLIAALLAYIISSDARQLGGRGIRVGGLGPMAWFFLCFFLLIVGGPLYLFNRRRALRDPRGGYGRGVRLPRPGWHPDPDDPQLIRWWDGSRWTDHTAIANLPPPPEL